MQLNSRFLAALFFSIWILVPILGNAQTCKIQYQKIDIKNGLSTSYINDVLVNKEGFLWAATEDGINRFDGKEVVKLRANTSDSFRLGFDNVTAIAELDDSKLIIGGAYGKIQVVDLKEQRATSVSISEIRDDHVNHIVSNRSHIFIVHGDRLSVLSKTDYTLVKGLGIRDLGETYFLKKDRLGIVWLSSEKGVFVSQGEGKMIILPNSQGLNLIDFTFNESEYWAISKSKLYRINSSLTIKPVYIENFKLSEYSFRVIGMLNDNILLGSVEDGFWTLNRVNNKITSCTNVSDNYPSYASISSSCQDLDGNLFLGTNGDGIIHFNLKSIYSPFNAIAVNKRNSYRTKAHYFDGESLFILNDYKVFAFDKNNILTQTIDLKLKEPYDITALAKVEKYFLIGTSKGLVLANNQGVELERLYADEENDLTLSGNRIKSITVSEEGIFIATEKGLDLMELKTGLFTRLFDNKTQITSISDGSNAVFVSSTSGAYIYREGRLNQLKISGIDENLFYGITSSYFDNNHIWIGTKAKGVLKLKKENTNTYFVNGEFTNELSNLHVNAITADDDGSVWVTTILGLNKILVNENRVVTYYESDGLGSDVFDKNFAYFANEKMYLGTRRGVLFFKTKELDAVFGAPKIILTDVVISGQGATNKFSLTDLEELEVDYFDYNFTLSFSAIDFAASDKLKYSYKLIGQSNEWVDLGNNNEVTFSNLQEGKYTLVVRAEDSHGELSSNEINLEITIKPPFYSTLWFRILIGMLFLGAVGGVYLYRLNRERIRNKLLEREVEKRTAILKTQNAELEVAKEEAQASDKAKSEFMATMSHEIRTPMNGILGSVGLLEQSALSTDQKNQLSIISESGDNMLAIINEILDYSKIESGKLAAVIEQFDVVNSLQNAAESHALRAKDKGLELTCFIDEELPRNIMGDRTRISQIVNNLLSNAVKFTKSGYVHMDVLVEDLEEKGKINLKIQVEDSGIGIPEHKQHEIWEAFSQVDNSSTREFGGTGLGLAIVRSMVHLLNGDISLSSIEGKGSVFTITIPVSGSRRILVNKEVNKGKLLFATSSAKTNELLSRYAKELNLDYEIYSRLYEISAINDDDKYDAIFIDVKTLTYEFAQGLLQVSEKVYLLKTSSNTIEGELPLGISAVIGTPVWRNTFQNMFLKEPVSESGIKGATLDEPQKIESLKILLAEDNKVNQMVTSRIFKKLNIKLDIAENGKLAVEMQKANKYDVIFMDLLMPEMDGNEATKTIRGFSTETNPYIVAFSANIFNQDASEFHGQGFNNVLSKPAKVDDIKNILNEVSLHF